LPWLEALAPIGRRGLAVTLFLIGAGMNLRTIRRVGPRAMVQGVLLWAVAGAGSLALILGGEIRI
jgi:uncharacterized membrane protein YadS